MNDMKSGTLVRLVSNKSLHNTIEASNISSSYIEDMGDFKRVPSFTILPDMIGICIIKGDKINMKILFGDKLVWVDKDLIEVLNE